MVIRTCCAELGLLCAGKSSIDSKNNFALTMGGIMEIKSVK
jgi:hypothetical protein